MTTASERIVARLRERAESESVNAHRVDVPVSKADRQLYAAQVLREEADAIAALPAEAGLSGLDHNALRRMDKEALRNEIERLRCLLHNRPQTVQFGPCAPADDPALPVEAGELESDSLSAEQWAELERILASPKKAPEWLRKAVHAPRPAPTVAAPDDAVLRAVAEGVLKACARLVEDSRSLMEAIECVERYDPAAIIERAKAGA